MTTTQKIDSLRGLEGAGSAAYFGSFDQMIRTTEYKFTRRVRRPPTDPVNSLLSFGYSLLRHDVQGAVNIVGFDPYLGYLHCRSLWKTFFSFGFDGGISPFGGGCDGVIYFK